MDEGDKRSLEWLLFYEFLEYSHGFIKVERKGIVHFHIVAYVNYLQNKDPVSQLVN